MALSKYASMLPGLIIEISVSHKIEVWKQHGRKRKTTRSYSYYGIFGNIMIPNIVVFGGTVIVVIDKSLFGDAVVIFLNINSTYETK